MTTFPFRLAHSCAAAGRLRANTESSKRIAAVGRFMARLLVRSMRLSVTAACRHLNNPDLQTGPNGAGLDSPGRSPGKKGHTPIQGPTGRNRLWLLVTARWALDRATYHLP